jgi:predicted helicase
MAPYAICHLKLGLFLEETGYKFDGGVRLGVYLINTLEDVRLREETQQLNLAIPQMEELIAQEARDGSRVKKQEPIMVVIGNPPYSGHSENNNPWIKELVNDYYFVDGKPLGEKNPKWLQDDYVKFIRFAQWRIDESKRGILGFISNHGFLDNPTFRGMRQHLIKSFDEIYIYDLHGNSKKKETGIDGSKDENVFDIQQGVSITLAIKGEDRYINHAHLYGLRSDKYQVLTENTVKSTGFQVINAQSPFYLFIPQDRDLLGEYDQYFKITDIMAVNSVGIVTARDKLTIQDTKAEVWNLVNEFISLDVESAREKYDLGKDSRDWKVNLAQEDIQNSKINQDNITPILYRPFDLKYTYYTGKSRGFLCMPRPEVMKHMLLGDNLGLVTVRQQSQNTIWNLCYLGNKIIESCVVSNKTREINYIFPLYLYPDTTNPQELQPEKRPNFSQDFLNKIETNLGYLPTAETIFYYIYAIFHSPTYRTRYAEFLKIDFPRVPLTSNNELFCQLAEYGQELAALHLMKSPQLNNLITEFTENGGGQIVDPGHPKYIQGAVVINKKGDKFTGVPEQVWNFYIGGYQVCQKWLKDRKGRTINNEDILHYQRVVVALQETIKLMQLIDESIPSFPI